MAGGLRHSFHCPMRWSDMDAYGHVNNVVYLTYLEEARVDMLFTIGAELGAKALSEGVLVARHEIDYRRPLVYHRSEERRVGKEGSGRVSCDILREVMLMVFVI